MDLEVFIMNIAVVDDMPDEIRSVRTLLKEYAAVNQLETEIVSFSSAEEFLKSYKPLLYTIVFMDIYMDGMTGTEAAERIRQTDGSIIIIFLTTSEDHRADAFHCHAYDYLIKPVTQESLFRTMDDILRLQTVTDRQKLFFLLSGENTACHTARYCTSKQNRQVQIIWRSWTAQAVPTVHA